MNSAIYDVYINEIDKIIKNKNTESVFLVGSSKQIDFNDKDVSINDIDIFVFANQEELQLREIKEIDTVEFDINYFSINKLQKLIDNKEYFFLKEMSNPKIVYDKTQKSDDIIRLCKEKFIEGPRKLSIEEKYLMKIDIKSKIDRLKEKHKFDKYEYEFLTNLYLKDIIIGYFIISNKWVPKDKNLLKELKIENLEIFNLVNQVQKQYRYEDLMNVYEYIFKNIRVSKT